MTEKRSKNNYCLVNPYVKGTFKNIFGGSSPKKAALRAWTSLSEYFSSSVPQYYFTLERLKDHKLYHFSVEEKQKGGRVNFTIYPFGKVSSKKEGKFRNKLAVLQGGGSTLQKQSKQFGGKKDDDDDDSSSSSSEDSDASGDIYTVPRDKYEVMTLPINYMVLFPTLYEDIKSYVIPPLSWPYYSNVELVIDL